MKLTPASAAESAMRCAVASSVRSPNIIVPRQSSDTFNPLLPSLRYSMAVTFVLIVFAGQIISAAGTIINDCGLAPALHINFSNDEAGCTGFLRHPLQLTSLGFHFRS